MKTVVFFLLCLVSVLGQFHDWDTITHLDEYVFREDGYYSYTPLDTFIEPGSVVYTYNMTSQIWMTDEYTDSHIWWHYVAIAIPRNPRIVDAAHLYIEGGSNDDSPPTMSTGRMQYIADFAAEVGAVAGLLRQNPNQPIIFADSTNISRSEDGIIAHTWSDYIESEEENPDQDMILQNPMTKAAKRAVDTLIEVAKEKDDDLDITKIMPAGFSKRGWVTWLLACVDDRVFAAAPIVLSLLNWNDNLHHHNEAMGGWSWAFGNYWIEGVSSYIDHERAYEIFEDMAIDPLSYNPRLAAMPKLLSVATGDQFFLIDDSHFFWDLLDGDKFICMFENSDHDMGGHGDRLYDNLKSFFLAAYHDFEWPKMWWTRTVGEDSGTLELWTDTPVLEAHAFAANTTEMHCEVPGILGMFNITEPDYTCRRDFRMRPLAGESEIWWDEVDFDVAEDFDENGRYYSLTIPTRDKEEGYRGALFRVVFEGLDGRELDFTTEAMIVPDEMPWERCVGEDECQGVLK